MRSRFTVPRANLANLSILAIIAVLLAWAVGAIGPSGPAIAAPAVATGPAEPARPGLALALTGQWQDDHGRRYLLRQIGDQVHWQATGGGGERAVFHGTLAGRALKGRWVGLAGPNATVDHALILRVASGDLLEVQRPAPAFGLGRLERVGPVVPSLKLKAATVATGASFQVSFTALASWPKDAWVGVVPAHIPHGSEAVNDQHHLSYHYLGQRSQGSLTFRAPTQPGRYDLRMHETDSGGVEVTYVTFEVVLAPAGAATLRPKGVGSARLKLKQTQFSSGQPVTVHFEAPPALDATAWVGVVPAHVPHGSEAVNDQHDLEFRYLNRQVRGQLTFTAPGQPGRYDLRLHDTDDNGREITHVTFEVR